MLSIREEAVIAIRNMARAEKQLQANPKSLEARADLDMAARALTRMELAAFKAMARNN
jgi:hypothetical protein